MTHATTATKPHIPSLDCHCSPDLDQDGLPVHTNPDGSPAKFEPPIVPGVEYDADGYSSDDHR